MKGRHISKRASRKLSACAREGTWPGGLVVTEWTAEDECLYQLSVVVGEMRYQMTHATMAFAELMIRAVRPSFDPLLEYAKTHPMEGKSIHG